MPVLRSQRHGRRRGASSMQKAINPKKRRSSSRVHIKEACKVHSGQMRTLFFSTSAKAKPTTALTTSTSTMPTKRTLERINANPPVYIVHNFLTQSELEHLDQIKSGKDASKFGSESYMMDMGGNKVFSEHRTSTFLSLQKMGDAKVRTIERRAAELVGVPTENVEPLQVVRYRDGQHFGLHHDCSVLKPNGTLSLLDINEPVRLVTFFVYLNSLSEGEGGCTYFPKLKLRVSPKRGAAVLFCNINEHGTLDSRVIHQAEPTTAGVVKFGMNIWVSSVTQMAYAQSKTGLRLNALPKPSPRHNENGEEVNRIDQRATADEKSDSPPKRRRMQPRSNICSTNGCSAVRYRKHSQCELHYCIIGYKENPNPNLNVFA